MLPLVFIFVTIALAIDSVAANNCGGTISKPGVLKSPPPFNALPLRYNYSELQERDCVWYIKAPENRKVVLKITQTLLDPTVQDECSTVDDHVAVFNRLGTFSDERLAIICNRRNSTIVFSSTRNTLTVTYYRKTDYIYANGGFNSEIIFSYTESDGCGGSINLTSTSDYTLKSPQIKTQEEDIFDCTWKFNAPKGTAIKITFSSFQVSCQEDHGLEIRDGNYPDSLLMGFYCGDSLPPVILSSVNKMSIRLSSNVQSYFTATLSIQEKPCKSSVKAVTGANFGLSRRRYKSPGYETIPLARGIHCSSEFRSYSKKYQVTMIRIKNLDLQPGSTAGKCDKDKLVIGIRSTVDNPDDKYAIENKEAYYQPNNFKSVYDGSFFVAHHYELCGSHKNLDFYLLGPVLLNLITTPENVSKSYEGVEIEAYYKTSCAKSEYTEPSGRILNYGFKNRNCSTLIKAPEGFTISVYFIHFAPNDATSSHYLDIYDGDSTDSKLLNSSKDCSSPCPVFSPVFSTSNHLLLYSVGGQALFDSFYMITNKGRGCGGYMFADQGVVTSPFYPVTYKEAKSCEFELETPAGTHLHLRFTEFDLGDDCASNYVQLLNREGKVLLTICDEKPNAFTSEENYVKIVSVTTANNKGKGWQAFFGSAAVKYF